MECLQCMCMYLSARECTLVGYSLVLLPEYHKTANRTAGGHCSVRVCRVWSSSFHTPDRSQRFVSIFVSIRMCVVDVFLRGLEGGLPWTWSRHCDCDCEAKPSSC